MNGQPKTELERAQRTAETDPGTWDRANELDADLATWQPSTAWRDDCTAEQLAEIDAEARANIEAAMPDFYNESLPLVERCRRVK